MLYFDVMLMALIVFIRIYFMSTMISTISSLLLGFAFSKLMISFCAAMWSFFKFLIYSPSRCLVSTYTGVSVSIPFSVLTQVVICLSWLWIFIFSLIFAYPIYFPWLKSFWVTVVSYKWYVIFVFASFYILWSPSRILGTEMKHELST